MTAIRASFAKTRPAPEPAVPTTSPRLPQGPFAKPVVGSGTAAPFLIACAAALVSLTGNPKAGAPVVRLSLAHIADTSAPPGWREALPSETAGEAPYGAATVQLSDSGVADSLPVANGGAAIITISGDTRLDSAQSVSGPGLAQAPIAGLFAQGAAGMLPVIGPDGRMPFQASRPAIDVAGQAAPRWL